MEPRTGSANPALLLFGAMATCGLLFALVAIPVFHRVLFTGQPNPEPIGWVILACLSLVTLFTITALGWLLYGARGRTRFTTREVIGIIWGALCLLFLIGEKVMIDEIAREWRMGWETAGEWIILYCFFTVQLGFNLYLLWLLKRGSGAGVSDPVSSERSERGNRRSVNPPDPTL